MMFDIGTMDGGLHSYWQSPYGDGVKAILKNLWFSDYRLCVSSPFNNDTWLIFDYHICSKDNVSAVSMASQFLKSNGYTPKETRSV